jgi:acyl-CoA thioesterase
VNEPSNAQALAEATGRAMYANDRASRALGITLEEIRPGYACMRMTVRKDMVNGHDICHGGIIFTLADSTFAFACNSHNHVTVAQGAAIEFLAPGKLGDVLTATGEERHVRGRNGVYDIVVTNQAGERIALFRGKSFRLHGQVVATGEPPPQPSA